MRRKACENPPIMSQTKEIGIIQFGEGNFLRCFVDWMIHELGEQGRYEKKVALVQPIETGRVGDLAVREGKYHCILQGFKEGKSVSIVEEIDVFAEFNNPYVNFEEYLELASHASIEVIVSNTTEAGIQFVETDEPDDRPPSGFPAKLAIWLKKRFEVFPEKEIHVVPCELIEKNGDTLKKCVMSYTDLWNWETEFKNWVENKVHFYNTLVDRIVPGYPKETDDDEIKALAESDPFTTMGEYYHQWVIENGERIEQVLPFKTANLNVIYAQDIKPYRDRKVRILNGAHTAMVSIGIGEGIETVGDFLKNQFLRNFLIAMMRDEIAPTIEQDQNEILSYVDEIIERFENPYIRHRLSDISLNSISKFKTRLLPSFFDYIELKGHPPRRIAHCLQLLINSIQTNTDSSNFRDDPKIISFIKNNDFDDILKSKELWGAWQAKLEDAMSAVEKS
jgi:tagaturonate reductase